MAKDAEERPIKDTLVELARSSRRDLIAGLVGVTVFPITYFAFLPLDQSVRTSFLVSAALMALSVITGLAVAAKADWSSLSRRKALGFASRLGAAAGLIVYLVGGGMAVLATTTRILVRGVAPGDMSWNEESMTGILAVLFCIVPTVALGSIGCLLGTMSRMPKDYLSVASPSPIEPTASSTKRRGRSILPWAILLFVLSVLSPTIPSVLASRKAEPPVAEDPTPASGDDFPGDPVIPFDYSRPDELDKAHASEWDVVARKTIRGFDRQSPAAISPDGRLLAFRESNGDTSLTVHDLNRDQTLRYFGSIPRIVSLTWSPDSKRLFCICQSEQSPFWVIEPETGQTFDLPVSKRLLRLAGDSWWWSTNEVMFVGEQEQVSSLDLDTLEIKPFKESPQWKKTRSGFNDHQTAIPQASLPATATCRVTIAPKLTAYIPPFEDEGQRWRFAAPAVLGVLDLDTESISYLPTPEVSERSLIVPSPDGSKILLAVQDNATVYYLGLKETSTVACTANLPIKPDSVADSAFRGLLDESRLTAFVCAPLKNPLNGWVVGPDRQKLKAMVRTTSWVGVLAEFEIVEQYSDIRVGDVLADIHYWDDGRPVLLDGGPFTGCWTPVNTKPQVKGTKKLGPIPRWNDADLVTTANTIEYRGWDDSGSRSRIPSSRDISSLVFGASIPTTNTDTPSPETIFVDIKRFVHLHHKKVSDRDLAGYVSDYARSVDFHDKGNVESDFIKKDQADYFSAFSWLSEEVIEEVEVLRLRNGLYRANYSIRSTSIRAKDQHRSSKVVGITLDIATTGRGRYFIVRERGKAIP